MASRIAFAILFLSQTLNGQKLFFQNYTSDNGLVQNQVFDIYQDRFGFMWFASTGGISRYDGVSFHNYTLKDGLPSLGVKCITEDHDGNLWFGTNNGIVKYDYRKFTPFTVDSGFVEGTVWSALCDQNGFLWFGTRGGGLVRYDGHKFTTFSSSSGLHNDGIYGLYEDRAGMLWIGTRSSGIYRYNGSTFTNFRLNANGEESIIRSFSEDAQGRLWVFSFGDGIYVKDQTGWIHYTMKNGLPENDMYRSCFLKSGTGLISSINSGFLIWDGTSFSRQVTTSNGLIGNQTLCIYEDREGTIWFGCANGISKLTTMNFESWTIQEGLSSSKVYSITEDNRHALWVGTDNGISIFTPSGITNLNYRDGLPQGQVWSLISNRDGSMWIGTVKGLYVFDQNRVRKIHNNSPVNDQTVSNMLRDRSGNLWLGTTVGVTKFDGESFRDYKVEDGLSNPYCYSIAQDCTGVMWFGTNHGLNRLDGDNFTSFTVKQGLEDDDINAMITAPDGTLWFGTNAGLHSYKDGQFRFFGDSVGISHGVLALARDSTGLLWVGSLYAAYAFDGTAVVKTISKDKGTIGTEIINNNSMYVDHKNNLWLGYFTGLTKYQTSTDRQSTTAPLVWITGWLINEKYEELPFWDADFIGNLDYKDNTLTFTFRGLSYRNEEDVRYQYYLEGLDADWSKPAKSPDIRYTNLNPGEYLFSVKAINGDGISSKQAASLRFVIRAPFWQKPWFLLLVMVIAVSVAWQGIRLRTRRILQRNRDLEQLVSDRTKALRDYSTKLEETNAALEESNKKIRLASELKSKFLSNMSHELRTPLNAIIGFSEILLDKNHSPLNSDQSKSVTAIQTSGKNLLNLVNDLLDLSKIEAGRMQLNLEPTDIAYLVSGVKDGLMPLFISKKQSLVLDISDDLPEVIADREKLAQVFINLLGNANKFTPPGGHIAVDVRRSGSAPNECVTVTVKDDGKGIPAAELGSIFDEFRQSSMNTNRDGTGLGLTLCRKLIGLHKGTIRALSDGKTGSAFVVELPVSSMKPLS